MTDFTDDASSSSSSNRVSAQAHLRSGEFKKRKAGRKKFNETRHPIYKGVRQRCGKWVCELRQPDQKKSRIWLGTFTCPDMAARAYDVAALALKGESAALNFPHEASTLPRIASTCSVKDLQSAAAEAAEGFFEVEVKASGLKEKEEEPRREVVYLDEEELFNMPGLIDSLAEGLILTPPAMQKGFNWNDFDDDMENVVDFSLWND
ncbi:dehydration-responsive element-binding protein 1F-like [Prunus avium]|uniref:Dehydration-responsive element-binding protein 1F-like n=1 Tax=Prunus avium TaxID=42229 RepID=A0A6P5S8L5_PRUAV|nr:dehydration-responsive element-binding protein 1F-like [Prunus avium]